MKQLRRPRRSFTPQQKFEMVQDILSRPKIQDGLDSYELNSATFNKWRRQLQVGINASLRNSRPPKDIYVKNLEKENRYLKEMVLNLSHQLTEAKKIVSL